MADFIFLSFQQTPVFWEEEEVSDHFFFFLYTVLSLLLVLLKQLQLCLSGLILAHLYSSVPFLWFMAEFSVYFAPSV